MAEKIVLETEIKTGNSGASIKSVKRELAELLGISRQRVYNVLNEIK